MKHTALWLFVFFGALYMLASPGVLNNPDAATRFLTAVSLARHGTIELDFPELNLDTFETAHDRQGHYVELFSEGQSLILAPFLAIVGHLPGLGGTHNLKQLEFCTAAIFFPLLSAFTIACFWHFLRLFCPDERLNVTACLLFGGATYYLVYAYNGHQEAQVSLFLILHFYWMSRHLRERRPSFLVFAACALGALVMFRPNLVYYAPISATWLAVKYRQDGASWTRLLAAEAILTAVSILTFAPQFYFNMAKTGNPLRLPYEAAGLGAAWQWSGTWQQGLEVCFFSPSKSLFIYNPILLVGAVAFVAFLPRLSKELFFPIFAYGIVNGLFSLHLIYWVQKGDISWGPRFFAHTVFLGVVAAWYGLRCTNSRWLRGAVVVAAALGAFVQLLGTLYASELDYGAIRGTTSVYGAHPNGADMAYEPLLEYRAADLARILAERRVVIPERFLSLPDAPKYFVPQWWPVRLLHMPEYGVPGPFVVFVTVVLLLVLVSSGLVLGRALFSPVPVPCR